MYLTDTKNMNDYNLKLILSILSGVIFSLVIIIVAFIYPIKDNNIKSYEPQKKDLHLLEQISNHAKK